VSFVKQLWALLAVNLRSVPQRLGLVSTVVIGVACAVGVLVAMLAMGVGARREAMGNVRPDRVILMSTGAQGAQLSSIPKDAALFIRDLPGIRRNSKGQPIAVSEVLVFVVARDARSGAGTGFSVTGASSGLADYNPELRLTAGRMFRPGLRELIASNVCVRQFAHFSVGDKRPMHGGDWPIVGNFDLGRGAGSCLVYADADTILSAFGRDTFNEVNVMLSSVTAFTQLTNALKANPTFKIEAKHEAELAEQSMQQLNGILNFVSYFVGAIMAIAATVGAVNSLYAVVDGRRRELATLRALGFKGAPIIVSTLLESVLLALPGACLGAAVAWVLFSGFTASPFGFTFHLAVTASLAWIGIGWALCMGLIGGLLPAFRAARIPVSVALRAT
jgi:putative ABC transport system permease protein